MHDIKLWPWLKHHSRSWRVVSDRPELECVFVRGDGNGVKLIEHAAQADGIAIGVALASRFRSADDVDWHVREIFAVAQLQDSDEQTHADVAHFVSEFDVANPLAADEGNGSVVINVFKLSGTTPGGSAKASA